MKTKPPSVLILSAGFSSRMGRLKANVRLHGTTFLDHILNLLPPEFPVFVVLGFQAETVRLHHPQFQGKWVENPKFSEGMVSSLKAGLKALSSSCPGVWIWPVDFPCLQVETAKLLFQASLKAPNQIVVPSYHYRRGHPVYLPKQIFFEVERLPNEAILRTILFREPNDVLYINVEDSGVLENFNTLADIQHFQQKTSPQNFPQPRLQEEG
ncbi:MAG: nucleotidyltransferase family protein [Planctomycetota bacterium]